MRRRAFQFYDVICGWERVAHSSLAQDLSDFVVNKCSEGFVGSEKRTEELDAVFWKFYQSCCYLARS